MDYCIELTNNLSHIDSSQRFTNLKAETLNQTSIQISWGLFETNLIFQNMTFSIYLGFGIYEALAGTTTDLYFVITNLNPNVNYTIRVESEIPYSTQIISSTTYHFLESDEVTEPTVMINNTSQSTQTSMTTPISEVLRISDYLSFILIGGILIMIIFLVLVVIIVVVTCCMNKRRAVKHTTTPNPPTDPKLCELPAYTNEVYEEIAYIPEKKEKIEMNDRRAVKHTTTPNPPTDPKLFELPAYTNEFYEEIAYIPEKKEKIEMNKIPQSNTTYSNLFQV